MNEKRFISPENLEEPEPEQQPAEAAKKSLLREQLQKMAILLTPFVGAWVFASCEQGKKDTYQSSETSTSIRTEKPKEAEAVVEEQKKGETEEGSKEEDKVFYEYISEPQPDGTLKRTSSLVNKEKRILRKKLIGEKLIPYEYTEEKNDNLLNIARDLENKYGFYCPDDIIMFIYWAQQFRYETKKQGIDSIDGQNAEKIEEHEIEFEGFDTKQEQKIKNIIGRTLPKTWIRNISKFKLASEAINNEIASLLTNKSPLKSFLRYYAATTTRGEGVMPTEITLSPLWWEDRASTTVLHESAHANDPFSMSELPIGLRIEFAFKVQDRLNDNSHFWNTTLGLFERSIDQMVSEAINKGGDPKLWKNWSATLKVKEFWAHLMAAYLADPDNPVMFPEDSELCEWYLAHIEGLNIPEDPQEWAKLREVIREKARGWAELREIIMSDETGIVGEQKLADLSRLLEQGKITSGQIANLGAEIQDGKIKDVLISYETGKIITIAK